jgi:hypothetical protein
MKNFGVMSAVEIGQQLDRSVSSVRNRINKLRLSKRNWTEKEIEFLAEAWGNKSIPLIASHLSRSVEAVRLKAGKLNLGSFLEAGERYVTLNFLLSSIGYTGGKTYAKISFVKNRGLPVRNKKVITNEFEVVYLDEWWEWAERNQSFLDFSKFEKFALGPEPEWVGKKRKRDIQKKTNFTNKPWTEIEDKLLRRYLSEEKYSVGQISKMLGRTAVAIQKRRNDLGIKQKPVKAENHIKWTDAEWAMLADMIKAGYDYELMSDCLGKSSKAIRGRVFDMYLTERLDVVRKYIGSGNWGDGAPDKPVRYRKKMPPEQRESVKLLMTELAGVFLAAAKIRSGVDDAYKDFWQKDVCANWDEVKGCTACEVNCDTCTSFRRIPVQHCKRCGKDFYERKSNYFCSDCRRARLQQARKKFAVLKNKKH